MATLRPPCTARSATFSPTGPAPMTTTSYVVLMSLPLRRAAEPDRRSEEEEAAEYGVPGEVPHRRIRRGGPDDERTAREHGDPATENHRPLSTQLAPADRHNQLHQTGHDRPSTPHPQHLRHTRPGGDHQAKSGEQADRDVDVQTASRPAGAGRAGVHDGRSDV